MSIELLIGDAHFSAMLYENETARAFAERLPMTLRMSDLNGNEKYHYMSTPIPTCETYYPTIPAGELMLFGDKCVVLFYDRAGGFDYTPIGKILNISGLQEALGTGDISITFTTANNS